MPDLFGIDLPEAAKASEKLLQRRGTHPKARASDLPGPQGETCRTCRHAYYRGGTANRYYKCQIAQRAPTGGSGTDIRLKDPSCSRWEKKVD